MRFLSANGFLPVCDCKNTQFPQHGKIYFLNPKKKCNFAVGNNQSINNKNTKNMAVKSMLRVRMSAKDAHYGGNLVDGAHMLHLFGDVATELLIIQDGDEGLFCAYDMVEFKAPVYAGDYIEAYGEITHVGNTSRKMSFEAYKVIKTRPDISDSAADVLEEKILVCRATGTCVTPKQCQRKNQ